jgi:hypothetical protein
MATNKKKEKENSLRAEFDKIQNTNNDIISNLNSGKYSSTLKDFPDLGKIEIYEYEKDVKKTFDEANRCINNMAKMYLGSYEGLLNDAYIQDRIKDDVRKYAESLVACIFTRRSIIDQYRIIDNGEVGPMFRKTVNETNAEQRENIKHSDALLNNIEKFYIKVALYYESTFAGKAIIEAKTESKTEQKPEPITETKHIAEKPKTVDMDDEDDDEEDIAVPITVPVPISKEVVEVKPEKSIRSEKELNDMIAKMQKKAQAKKDKQNR